MSAYLVVSITAHNLNWLPEYLAHVPQIVRSHGGEYVAISKGIPGAVEVVEGTSSAPQGMVVFTFPSVNAVKSFLDSPEYAPYRKARNAATESNFFAFENDASAPQFSQP